MTPDTLGAETNVVGSMCIDPRCLVEITGQITPGDFAMEINRNVYQAVLELERDGTPIDPVAIADRCAKGGNPVGADYLVECMTVTGTAANAGLYAGIVRESSLRRSLAELAGEITEQAVGGADPKAVLDYIDDTVRAMEQHDTVAELRTSTESVLDFYDYREQLDQGKAQAFTPTGLRPLDRLLEGGMLAGGLYILGARPGAGKTTLGLHIADAVAANTGPVLFVSLEMDERQITAKRISRETGIPYGRLMMGQLSEDEYTTLADGGRKVAAAPVTVNRKPGATVANIGRMARRVPGLRLVVVDYLGLVRPVSSKNGRYDAVTQISNDLKQLARTLRVPILALSQLNRENVQRRDKRPTLADLRDSGAIEQDADGVLLLHRDDYYEDTPPDPSAPSLTECILAKNRHGSTGKVDLTVYFSTGRIFPVRYGG